MDHDLRGGVAAPYDYRKYDRIWQRVAPSLSPYPGGTEETEMPEMELPAPREEAGPPALPEGNLPGAEQNPCCMGTQAMEALEVLEGFAEDEQAAGRKYRLLSRQAPAFARPVLMELARRQEMQLRRLLTVYYLITGSCYQPGAAAGQVCPGEFCAALRERYHDAACQWMNYIRAAEGTTDPCLQKIFRELAEEKERQSRCLAELLGRAITGTCPRRGMGV